ncbi:MAG: MoaD/ThiS family protein [Desulfobacterales bacterium]
MSSPSVRLHLYAGLRALVPDCPEEIPLPESLPLGEFLERLGIPTEKIHLVFVDGKRSELSTPLRGGERIGVFPPVGGG